MPVKFRHLKEVPMEKNGTHKARSTQIQFIFKTEYFLSGIWRAVSKQGSFGDLIHWFRVDRGLIRVKKIKIRFPEKYSDLCGASLKILSIKHTFLEITKASLFLKYNVIYSTFTKDYFFSLFYSLIFSAVDPVFTTNCSQKYCP